MFPRGLVGLRPLSEGNEKEGANWSDEEEQIGRRNFHSNHGPNPNAEGSVSHHPTQNLLDKCEGPKGRVKSSSFGVIGVKDLKRVSGIKKKKSTAFRQTDPV